MPQPAQAIEDLTDSATTFRLTADFGHPLAVAESREQSVQASTLGNCAIILNMNGQVRRENTLLDFNAERYIEFRNLRAQTDRMFEAIGEHFDVQGSLLVSLDTEDDPDGCLVIRATVHGEPAAVAQAKWDYTKRMIEELDEATDRVNLLLIVR